MKSSIKSSPIALTALALMAASPVEAAPQKSAPETESSEPTPAEEKADFIAIGRNAVADYQRAEDGEKKVKPKKNADDIDFIRADFEACSHVENLGDSRANGVAGSAIDRALGSAGSKIARGLGGLGGLGGLVGKGRDQSADRAECTFTKSLEPQIKSAIALEAAGKDASAAYEAIGRKVDRFESHEDESRDRRRQSGIRNVLGL